MGYGPIIDHSCFCPKTKIISLFNGRMPSMVALTVDNDWQ
jgi:hypothetical protein